MDGEIIKSYYYVVSEKDGIMASGKSKKEAIKKVDNSKIDGAVIATGIELSNPNSFSGKMLQSFLKKE